MGEILHCLYERIKHWTEPATSILINSLHADFTRSHTDLVVDNVQLRQHWARDFAVVNDRLFRQWYVFVETELKTRRIIHTGVTKYPTDKWTAQQLREATPWGKGPKYLIRDRDSKYAKHFSAVSAGIKELKTPYRTPQANGVCERFMGSQRRECISHILIHNEKHLQRVVTEYTAYFNQERPHQGIEQRIPDKYDQTRSKPTSGRITSKTILGGLHHSYSRTIYLN
jgi:putative transposase